MFVVITIKDNVLQDVIGCRSKLPAADALFTLTLGQRLGVNLDGQQLQDAMENGFYEIGDVTICLIDLSNWTDIQLVLTRIYQALELRIGTGTPSLLEKNAIRAAKALLTDGVSEFLENDGPHLDSICALDGQLSNDGWELSDGGVIEHPDDYPRLGGTIRRRDKDGNCEEIRVPGNDGYGEWLQLFASPYCQECNVPDHDVCSMTAGCPCCDDTIQQQATRRFDQYRDRGGKIDPKP